jgi:hypothetical protein
MYDPLEYLQQNVYRGIRFYCFNNYPAVPYVYINRSQDILFQINCIHHVQLCYNYFNYIFNLIITNV